MSNTLMSDIQNPAQEASVITSTRLGMASMPRRWWHIDFTAVAVDVVILIGLFWLTSHIENSIGFLNEQHFSVGRVAVFAVLLLNLRFGLYSRSKLSVTDTLRKSSAAVLYTMILGGLLSSALRIAGFWESAPILILLVPLTLIARQATGRWALSYRSNPFHADYVVTVGHGTLINQLVLRLESCDERSNRVVACFATDEATISPKSAGVHRYSGTSQVLAYLAHNPADVVILALALDELTDAKQLIASILEMGLAVGLMPESLHNGIIDGRHDVSVSNGYAGIQMVILRTVHQSRGYLIAKRALDIVLSSIALLALSPLFILIAVLVKFSSEGPIFYPWEVLGRNRKPFTGYKFRTMVRNADEIKQDLMKFNEMSGPVFKMRNDPRITSVGRWLRKYSLDEIPQFYSVLKGDMSLVGPRPPSKSESDRFDLWQHRKLSVKPGITCLWQVNGRTEIADFAEWAALDIQYIESSSFLLDLKILLKTVPVVLMGHGAY